MASGLPQAPRTWLHSGTILGQSGLLPANRPERRAIFGHIRSVWEEDGAWEDSSSPATTTGGRVIAIQRLTAAPPGSRRVPAPGRLVRPAGAAAGCRRCAWPPPVPCLGGSDGDVDPCLTAEFVFKTARYFAGVRPCPGAPPTACHSLAFPISCRMLKPGHGVKVAHIPHLQVCEHGQPYSCSDRHGDQLHRDG